MSSHVRYFGLVAAAGSGSRLGGGVPKQYLDLGGKPVLRHSVERLAAPGWMSGIFVVLAAGDRRYASAIGDLARVTPLYCGGESRAASVRNALERVRGEVRDDDWMLIHDAARPCLDATALERLRAVIGDDEVGGLLAVPVADTLKRGDRDQRVAATVEREHLWHAQTPQMFRYRLLCTGLSGPDAARFTDEAQAIEAMGLRPRLVSGSKTNIKVTFAEDLMLAGAILGAAGEHG